VYNLCKNCVIKLELIEELYYDARPNKSQDNKLLLCTLSQIVLTSTTVTTKYPLLCSLT